MITYASAEALWLTRRAGYDTRGLRGEFRGAQACHLRKQGDVFVVHRHGNPIVWIHPDHYLVNMQGWEAAPTTRHTVQEVTGAWVHSARRGSEVSTSIGGYPYFAGIRLHTNGVVFEEDRRPWKRRFISKEGQRTWRELMKWLRLVAEARVNIGEFAGGWAFSTYERGRRLEQLNHRRLTGTPPQDVPHDLLNMLLAPHDTWEAANASLAASRADFYHHINAYEYRETK